MDPDSLRGAVHAGESHAVQRGCVGVARSYLSQAGRVCRERGDDVAAIEIRVRQRIDALVAQRGAPASRSHGSVGGALAGGKSVEPHSQGRSCVIYGWAYGVSKYGREVSHDRGVL